MWIECGKFSQSLNIGFRLSKIWKLSISQNFQCLSYTQLQPLELQYIFNKSLLVKLLNVWNWKLANQAGLEKVPISPWLVTLLHICGVIPTPQSPILPETPSWYSWKLRASVDVSALMIERWYRRIEWWVFHNVLRVFHNVLRVFHNVLLVVHDESRFISVS